jgi:hypothetical protein
MLQKHENLTSRTFFETLNSSYTIALPGHPALTLELFEVEEKNYSPRLDQFSLFFRGPVSPQIPQATHRLRHDVLGEVDLFLVPVGADAEGTVYQSVFSRFRRSESAKPK